MAGFHDTGSALCGERLEHDGVGPGGGRKNNKLVFAVVVKQIFNQGNLALVDEFMARDVTNNGAPLGRDGFKGLVKISVRSRRTSSSR